MVYISPGGLICSHFPLVTCMDTMQWSSLCIFLLAVSAVAASRHQHEFIRSYKKAWASFQGSGNETGSTVSLQRQRSRPLKIPPFNCDTKNTRSTARPTSVHKLRPGDVDIIAGIGDSITAANGLLSHQSNLIDVLTQYRGQSWSIGGDGSYEKSVITLTNILRKFNPKLKGFSTGYGSVDEENTGFNVAIPGSVVGDLPDQAKDLVDRLKADSAVNFQRDWKMVTIFIGGNDLCKGCGDRKDELGPSEWRKNYKATLDILYDNMPRTFVNIVPILDLSAVPMYSTDIWCGLVQEWICPCVRDPKTNSRIPQLARRYNNAIKDLLDSGRYDGKDDFTIVYQPFLQNTRSPLMKNSKEPDTSYFAPDCFHFNQKGHQLLALSLWNSMVERAAYKPTRIEWHADPFLKCLPKDSPYLPTELNGLWKEGAVQGSSVQGLAHSAKGTSDKGNSISSLALYLTMGFAGLACLCVSLTLVVVYRRKRQETGGGNTTTATENPAFSATC